VLFAKLVIYAPDVPICLLAIMIFPVFYIVSGTEDQVVVTVILIYVSGQNIGISSAQKSLG
jgi:hypothetical protein